MDSDKIEIEKDKNEQLIPNKVLDETKPVKNEIKSQGSQKKELLMKLYVYGSCESDQFRHPNKLSESKKPICLSTIQSFDLNEDQDDEPQTKQNIYPNPLFKKSIYKIACGGLHSVVLTLDGKAYTFGCNDEGALGRKGPECIPMQVVLDHPVDLISAGDNHSMFANSVNGIVYFTGNYNYLRGQKMVESVTEPIKFTSASMDVRNKNQVIQKLVSGANHTCILVNNKIFCRGEPQSFTTGRRINQRRKTQNSLTFDGVGLNHVLDVWCGGYHTVAKTMKGKQLVYYTWGKNDQGQLGIGSFTSQAFPVEIKALRSKNITKVAAGAFFTLFLADNGEILACGNHQYGQLGLGEDYQFIASSEEQSEEEQKEQQLQKISEPQQLNHIVDKLSINQDKQSKMMNQVGIKQKQQSQIKPDNIQVTVNAVSSHKKKYEQKNTYIRSVRPLSFSEQVSPKSPITNISAGSQFGFAWNSITQLYSWGFGMNYVLLNGKQSEQYQPYQVRNKIINDEIITDIAAGGQHVLYTAYQKIQNKHVPNVTLELKVTSQIVSQKGRLSRKRKN